jgi:hypothetical protein
VNIPSVNAFCQRLCQRLFLEVVQLEGMNRRSVRAPTVPVRQVKVGSFRIENDIVIGNADEDPLEEHGW